MDVEFDSNGDGIADDWNYGGATHFEYSPSDRPGFGSTSRLLFGRL